MFSPFPLKKTIKKTNQTNTKTFQKIFPFVLIFVWFLLALLLCLDVDLWDAFKSENISRHVRLILNRYVYYVDVL